MRAVDFLVSLVATILLFPFMIPIMLILALTGEREIFFLQERVGRDGKLFGLLKFTTMLRGSAGMEGGSLTKKDDPRITRFGRFLRRTKINELPQLLNILAGQMSFVGPRPQTKEHFDLYAAEVRDRIESIMPGLTGLGSIIFRSEEELLSSIPGDRDCIHDTLIVPYKGALEVWYAEHRSLKTNILLILLTAWVVIKPRSDVYKQFFKDLPLPPPELARYLF